MQDKHYCSTEPSQKYREAAEPEEGVDWHGDQAERSIWTTAIRGEAKEPSFVNCL